MDERTAVSPVPVSVRRGGVRLSGLPCLGVAALSAAALVGASVVGFASPAAAAVAAPVGLQNAAAAAPAVAPPDVAPLPERPASAPVALTTILRVTVHSAATGAVIPNAAVRLESETELSQSVATDIAGVAIFNRSADRFTRRALPDGLYNVIVAAVGFQTTTVTNITVTADHVTNVDVQMNVRREVINVRRVRELIDTHDTSISVTRDRDFMQEFPLNAGNRQNLSSILTSVPGVARDVENRIVPRGEDNVAQSMYTDGLMNPQYAQGSLASFWIPDTIQQFKAITGGFAPEYGGSGLVLDTELRSPPGIHERPYLDIGGRVGEENTTEDYFALGDRLYPHRAAAIGTYPTTQASQIGPTAQTPQARAAAAPVTRDHSFGYLLVGSDRYTDEVAEPTVPTGGDAAHNYGASEVAFGKFEYQLTPRGTMRGVFNFSSGRSDIANRMGLSDSYAPFGQGYGFLGQNTRLSGLPTQQDDNQLLYQKDNNNLVFFQIDHRMPRGGLTRIGVGAAISDLADYNKDYLSPITHYGAGSALPDDNSLEYLPTVRQHYDQIITQIDFTPPAKRNSQLKFGATYQDLIANETYQYIPQSQLAANALTSIDPRLGVQYNPQTGYFNPLLVVNRKGYYAAAYLQDTVRARSNITINWGARIDDYEQQVGTGDFNTINGAYTNGGVVPNVSQTTVSPRLNLAYAFPQGGSTRGGRLGKLARLLTSRPTVARIAYDHLFTPPGMGQGAFLGNQPEENAGGGRIESPLVPQQTDQYDVSLEQQLSSTRILRLGIYEKNISHYLETEQLIPGMEGTMTAIFNQSNVIVDGTELTFDLLPPNDDGTGMRGFVVLSDSYTRPKNGGEVNNYGYSLGAYTPGTMASSLETDQQDTITLGLAYKHRNGATAGLSVYYGSGLYASALRPPYSPERVQSRQTIESVNLRLATGNVLYRGHGFLQLDVENLTDNRARMEYEGAYAGNRFQEGRRAFASINMRF